MHPDPRAALEDLDRRRRETHVERLVHERIRDRVVVAIDLDVVIDVDAGLQPVGMDEALGRQRLQGGAIQLLEEVAPRASAVALHRTGIERRQQLADAGIERGETEEGLVPQARQDPALGDLDGDLDLRFVPRFRGPRRHARRCDSAAPTRRRSAGRPARTGTAASRRCAVDPAPTPPARRRILDGADVARNPVGALLRAGRLGEGVVRRAEHGDKQLDGDHLAGGGVDDRRPHARRSRRRPSRRPCAPGASTDAAAPARRDSGRRRPSSGTRSDARRGTRRAGAPGSRRAGGAPGGSQARSGSGRAPSISAGVGPYNVRSRRRRSTPRPPPRSAPPRGPGPPPPPPRQRSRPGSAPFPGGCAAATHFSRRISRIFCIGTRSVAIRSLSPPWDKERIVEPGRASPTVITTRGTGDHDAWNRLITMPWNG